LGCDGLVQDGLVQDGLLQIPPTIALIILRE
jgi:hypothetical protein